MLISEGLNSLANRPNATWLPFEEVSAASLDRSSPIKATVATHSGRSYQMTETWTGQSIGKSQAVLQDILEQLEDAQARASG
jgi:hypothetical protein